MIHYLPITVAFPDLFIPPQTFIAPLPWPSHTSLKIWSHLLRCPFSFPSSSSHIIQACFVSFTFLLLPWSSKKGWPFSLPRQIPLGEPLILLPPIFFSRLFLLSSPLSIIFNIFLSTGSFLMAYKHTNVFPVLNEPSLDPTFLEILQYFSSPS